MATETIKLGPDGGVVIPEAYREALGAREGDELIVRLENGALHLTTRDNVIRRAQALVRQHVPEGTSLADELIARRRKEATQE